MTKTKLTVEQMRERIYGADARPLSAPVRVEKWGLDVYLRDVLVSTREQFDLLVLAKSRGESAQSPRSFLLQHCVVTEDGEMLFTPEDAAKFDKLGGKPVEMLFDMALDLTGMLPKKVDTTAGNS